jgi:hypothetical protein
LFHFRCPRFFDFPVFDVPVFDITGSFRDVSSSGKSKKESFVGIKFAEQKSIADELRCFLNTSESAI